METYIHRYIETAAQYPDRTAVVDFDGRYSYKEIDHDSNLLARRIVELTGGANEYVVIVLPKRALFTKSVLAVNRAGSAYVPLSADYPADRIDYIIKECQPAAVITTRKIWKEKTADGATCAAEKLIMLDDIDWKADAGESVNLSTIDRRAMMIYTSGTTGRPKGVIHSFSSLTYMANRHQLFAKLPLYSTAMIADYTFIAAFSDSFGPLTVGGTIHLIDDSVRADLNRLNQYITDNHIIRMFMGSQMGVTMLNMFDLTLRVLILGGEKTTGIQPGRIGNVKVMNTYGMSEFTPVATHQILDGETAPPIGKPYTDVECYILDADGQRITEPGQVGELYVSGPMMSVGYFGMPELTAERYLDNPFKPGTKMFRTGDRVSLTEDGELIHCGRADNMFKLRGFRIEPGEVENVAMQFPGMGNCACLKKVVNGEETLCLYFEASAPIDTEALHTHLSSTLAHYMVPDFLIQLDKLPRNARGKIDRKSMPDPDRKTELLMIAPESDDERLLFTIAASLLGKTEFGVTDNLFAVGMSSIMAMKMAAEAQRQGMAVKGADIIRLKTIRNVIQENIQMVRFYREYDPAKDTVIFMQGIMVASDTVKKIDLLAERYNVLVVEAIQEHYHYVFEEEPMAEVIELYYSLADYYIPREAQVRLVVGMSFGGKLACLMADKWQKERGQQPAVIMGDTVMVGVPAMAHAILNGELDKYIEENHLPKEVFNESFKYRITIVAQLENRGYKLPAYQGRVIIMHAQISTGAYEGDNLARWRRVVPQLEVVGVDYPHNIVCCDSPETLPIWQKLFSEIK